MDKNTKLDLVLKTLKAQLELALASEKRFSAILRELCVKNQDLLAGDLGEGRDDEFSIESLFESELIAAIQNIEDQKLIEIGEQIQEELNKKCHFTLWKYALLLNKLYSNKFEEIGHEELNSLNALQEFGSSCEVCVKWLNFYNRSIEEKFINADQYQNVLLTIVAAYLTRAMTDYGNDENLENTSSLIWLIGCNRPLDGVAISSRGFGEERYMATCRRLLEEFTLVPMVEPDGYSSDEAEEFDWDLIAQKIYSDEEDVGDDSEVEEVNDKAELLALVIEDGDELSRGTSNLKDDEEVVLAAVANSGGALQYASDRLKANKNIVIAALQCSSDALEYASDILRADRQLVLSVVKDDGTAIQYAALALRADREIATAAVGSNSGALEYISGELRDDKELVLEALRKDGTVFEYASDRLKSDRMVVLAAVKSDANMIRNIPDNFLSDKEIILSAVSAEGNLLEYASNALKTDKDVVLAAVANDGSSIQYASDAILGNQELVKQLITAGGFFQYLPDSMKSDEELLEKAKSNLKARLMASGEWIDVYSEKWLSEQSDRSSLAPQVIEKFDKSFGPSYRGSLQVAYLTGTEVSNEFASVYPSLAQQVRDGKHRPDFLFFSQISNQILCVGLGRKNNLFALDSESNRAIDVFGVPGDPNSDKQYMSTFARLDHGGVVKTIVHALHEAALAMDQQANIEDYESSEYEEMSEKIGEAVSKIQQYFPLCDAGDLNTGDY